MSGEHTIQYTNFTFESEGCAEQSMSNHWQLEVGSEFCLIGKSQVVKIVTSPTDRVFRCVFGLSFAAEAITWSKLRNTCR